VFLTDANERTGKKVLSRFSEMNDSKSFACHSFDHICQEKIADRMGDSSYGRNFDLDKKNEIQHHS
jgi:hypothetical protein